MQSIVKKPFVSCCETARNRYPAPLIRCRSRPFFSATASASAIFCSISPRPAVNPKIMTLWPRPRRKGGCRRKREAIFAGEKINLTEKRAVLHTALRTAPTRPVIVDGADVKCPTSMRFLPPWAHLQMASARQDRRCDRQDVHRYRQYRHRRFGPRPGHDNAGARPQSRRPARPLRVQRRWRAYRRHAEAELRPRKRRSSSSPPRPSPRSRR